MLVTTVRGYERHSLCGRRRLLFDFKYHEYACFSTCTNVCMILYLINIETKSKLLTALKS